MTHLFVVIAALVAQASPAGVEASRKQLADLLDEQWEYTMRTNPEWASVLGDKRYNDQVTDFSEKAVLADIEAQRAFLARFKAVDPAGFPEQDALNHALIVRQLEENPARAHFKAWEMPRNHFDRIHINAPHLVSVLSFETVNDYDDYVARLRKLPV